MLAAKTLIFLLERFNITPQSHHSSLHSSCFRLPWDVRVCCALDRVITRSEAIHEDKKKKKSHYRMNHCQISKKTPRAVCFSHTHNIKPTTLKQIQPKYIFILGY